MSKKRVLIITYNFPPVNSPGIYRVLGFLRHLPEYGFETQVVTAGNPHGDATDPDLLDKVPATAAVYRTYSFEIDRVQELVCRLMRKLRRKKKSTASGGVPSGDEPAAAHRPGTLELIEKHIFIPDAKIGWVPFAFFRCLLLILRHRVDILLTSSPPSSLQLTGLLLKKITGVKWVADFRDPWSTEERTLPLRERVLGLMEKAVLVNADHIIVNTPGMKKGTGAAWQEIDGSKVTVITNGYDRGSVEAVRNDGERVPVDRQRLNITFIGTAYPGMVDGLFEALGEMKKEDRSLGRRLVINMVGNCLDYEKAFSRRQDIDDLIHYAGVVPHRETFTRMQQAQVLLLLLPDNEKGRSCIPSKLFTYILTGKPVLALVPDGDAADVVRGTKTGIVVNPRDKVAVKAALRKLTVEHGQGILRSLPDWEEISKYDRRILTGALAGVFHEITDDGCPSAFTVQEGKGADTCRDSGSISCMSRTPSK